MREVAGLVAGVAVDNHYGIAFHSTVLTGLGFSASDLAAIRAGGPPEDTTAAAVQALATEIVVQRGKVSDETIARARASSLDDEAILEVVLEVTFASLVGLIDNLVGHVELDDFLRALRPCERPSHGVRAAGRRGRARRRARARSARHRRRR